MNHRNKIYDLGSSQPVKGCYKKSDTRTSYLSEVDLNGRSDADKVYPVKILSKAELDSYRTICEEKLKVEVARCN